MNKRQTYWDSVPAGRFFWMEWEGKQVRFLKGESGSATSVDEQGNLGHLTIGVARADTQVWIEEE